MCKNENVPTEGDTSEKSEEFKTLLCRHHCGRLTIHKFSGIDECDYLTYVCIECGEGKVAVSPHELIKTPR